MRRILAQLRHAVAPFVKFVFAVPADVLVLSSRALNRRINDCVSTSSAVLENPLLAAKFHALAPESRWLLSGSEAASPGTVERDEHGQPVPPVDMHEGYGGGNPAKYLATGREDSGKMLAILRKHGYAPQAGQRILDFGCSAGRLIRHLAPHAKGCEIRGVDISARHICWAQANLNNYRFTTTTTLPHLPFADGYFDLIYSGSVFTHISDLADMWLMELRRLLKPGGILYATVHDDVAMKVLREEHPTYFLTRLMNEFHARTPVYDRKFQSFTLERSPQHAMVFYHRDYLQAQWGRELEVLAFETKAYGYQSALVMRKN